MTETSLSSSPSPSSSRTRRGDDLTVVLFKDHYVPRTLRIPLAWIPRLGLVLAGGGTGLLIAVLLAGQGWYLAWKAQPQRLRTLEDQIENLRRSNDALETELRALRRGETTSPLLGMHDGESESSPEQIEGVAAEAAKDSNEGARSTFDSLLGSGDSKDGGGPSASSDPFGLDQAKVNAPSKDAKNPPTPGPGTLSVVSSATTAGIPFLLPDATEGGVPDPATLPFRLTPVQTEFNDGSLNLKFALQYIAEDGGNQQGRIVILGRAGDRFASYPDAALSTSAFPRAPLSQAPLTPERGEFFSVSRYREVLGQLRMPADAREEFSQVWILIFNTRGKLLFSQNFGFKGTAAATPAKKTAPGSAPSASAPSDISR